MGELHLAIILDGNRRWAKKKGKLPWEGHREGTENVKRLLRWCKDLPIQELTLYTFSTENFRRSAREKDVLFRMFRNAIRDLEKKRKEIEKEGKFNIRFCGRLSLFPKDLAESMRRVMRANSPSVKRTLNLCMGYGGRQEIVDGVNALIREGKKEVDEEDITSSLSVPSSPDLIIRPGGEKRVSNFLLWQGSYSEWVFSEKLWPDFTKKDIVNALTELKKRKRRHGK